MSDAAPLIVVYNRFFSEWPDLSSLEHLAAARFAFGPERVSEAAAVVFHVPTLGDIKSPRKATGQIWVAWSLESRETCRRLDDPEFMERFDLTMTYERSSDIWYPYFGPGTVPGLLRAPSPKTEKSPVVHLQSNPYDASGRARFAFDLMRRVKVDSYGDVLRTRRERIPPGWRHRVAVMARYKFTLALENSISPDYVTDKFFDPLVVGSVPVYRGAAEVADFAPAVGSYINARDFSGPAELGEYLGELDRDDEAYARYHAWRQKGLSPEFRAVIESLREPPFLRLARRVAEIKS